jgi:RNA polymerase sigma-70 factor (ECF subfamily)
MMGDRDDVALLEAARSGDVDSFGELYRRHYRGMVGIARSVLFDPHLAEDAAQETFAVACRTLCQLKRNDRFQQWLAGICRNVARKMVGAKAARRDLGDPESPPADDESESAHDLVREVVNRLPVRFREVILLRYYSGLSQKEIATSLGISTAAVNGRLTRAKRLIGRQLGRTITPGEDHDLCIR